MYENEIFIKYSSATVKSLAVFKIIKIKFICGCLENVSVAGSYKTVRIVVYYKLS